MTTSPASIDIQTIVHYKGTRKSYVGLEFISEEEAYEFYNDYAKQVGFSIRRANLRRLKQTKEIISRLLVCSKEGQKDLNDKRRLGVDVKRRRESRENCEARLSISVNDKGIWIVKRFIEEHNHPLVTPSKIHMLRSHHQLSSTSKCLIQTFNEFGIGPSRISAVRNASGEDFVSPQNCVDHLRMTRTNNINGECMAMVKHFLSKKANDDGFYFQYEIDEFRTARSIFWADGRSRATYLTFGDVLVFDVTYKTNSFNMPFAPFTGVNHHRQSTLFGCALLADETQETFVWLFNTWLDCMNGKMPVSIITDQDKAICNAIAKVFPYTKHRYCSWHLEKNAIVHLRGLKMEHQNFKEDYDKWIYGSKTNEEFENKWQEIRECYKLDEGSWLANMYAEREHWVPLYLNDTFFAGMTSSQRFESINAFFDGFVNANTSLSDFVLQYDRAITSRRALEERSDFKTINFKPTFFSHHPMEAQVSQLYTQKIFETFQEELKQESAYMATELVNDGTMTLFSVERFGNFGSKRLVSVSNIGQLNCQCSCKKFEMEGIPCRHMLHIFKVIKRLMELPSRYILFRWTILARYNTVGSHVQRSITCLNDITPLMAWGMRSSFHKASNLSMKSIKHFQLALQKIDELVKMLDEIDVEEVTSRNNGDRDFENDVPLNELPLEYVIRDPCSIKSKGRPKRAQRIKSSLEIALSQENSKKRTCGHSGEKGHYISTCSQLKAKEL